MAKRPTRTEANESSAPAAEPKARPERRRRARETAPADTFAARSDAAEPSDAPVSESGTAPLGAAPTEEDIRVRAYLRYLERGGFHGLEFEDWLEAERELKDGK